MTEHENRVEYLEKRCEELQKMSQDARRAGRSEALEILRLKNPEAFFSECTTEESFADTGEWGSYWDDDRLQKLFDVIGDDPMRSLLDHSDRAYWEARSENDELKQQHDDMQKHACNMARERDEMMVQRDKLNALCKLNERTMDELIQQRDELLAEAHRKLVGFKTDLRCAQLVY